MKKSHVFAVCLAVLCLCLWGCGGKKPDTLELVEKKGKLVVALSGESEGDMSRAWAESLEREVIESLGSRLGVEVLYEYMEEGQGVQAVAEGRADIAAGAVILEESGNTGYSITYGCRPVYIATVSGGVSFPGELANSKVGFDPGVGPTASLRADFEAAASSRSSCSRVTGLRSSAPAWRPFCAPA